MVADQLRLAQGWVRCGRCGSVFMAPRYLFERPAAAAATPDLETVVATDAPRSDAADVSATTTTRYLWDRAEAVRPPRRLAWTALWAAGALGAGMALALQLAHAWRHDIALHLPAARPALQTACTWINCRIEPVRRLAELSVESSELSQWAGTIYRLSLVLRNRADVSVMPPTLDLTLTDARGAVIARKAISLADFGVTSATLGAREQLSLQGYLNAGDPNVAGYTIELFHP